MACTQPTRRSRVARQRRRTALSRLGLRWESRGEPKRAAQAGFFLALPAIPCTWELLKDADEAASETYWASIHPYAVPDEHAETMALERLARGRPWAVIDLLTLYCVRDGQTLWHPDVELVAKALEQAIRADPQSHSGSTSLEHEIGVLLDYLGDADMPQKVLACFEWAFFAVLEHTRTPHALFAGLAEDPALFVELVSYAFRGDNKEPREHNEQSLALARNAMSVLDRWRTPPGSSEGTVEGDKLRAWVRQARQMFEAADRVGIGDDQIGHLLSGSPLGNDGAWPAEPVRDLVEELESKPLEAGLSTGKSNSRGITSRGPYDGGNQERGLAATFRQWSEQIGARWPRTARLVRGLAEEYKDEARMHDSEAEGLGDEG